MTSNENTIINQALEILEARLRVPGQAITEPKSAAQFLTLKLGESQRELFAVLLLDSQHRVIEYRELFQGTVDRAQVYPGEVLRAALLANATAMIIAHNHPSQSREPSGADIALTARLQELLEMVGVNLLDHVIVAGTHTTSFSDRGLL